MRKSKKNIAYAMGLRKETKGQINRKSMRQSRMANADKLATLGTQDTGQRKTKQTNTTQKTTKMSNTNTFVNRGEPRLSRRLRQFLPLIRHP